MSNFSKNDLIKGLRCEFCSEERTFGNPPNNNPDNLYVYIDLSGATRCFCKEHMSYGKNENNKLLNYEDEHDFACYGAELISKILTNTD